MGNLLLVVIGYFFNDFPKLGCKHTIMYTKSYERERVFFERMVAWTLPASIRCLSTFAGKDFCQFFAPLLNF